MTKKMPMRIDEQAAATGGTYDWVKSNPVPLGELWCVQGHSFENQTGARGTARAFIIRGGYQHPLWEEPSLAAGELAWFNREVYLREKEQLAVRQESCTAADVLRLYGDGYRVEGKYIEGE